jgi:hypothetical protein
MRPSINMNRLFWATLAAGLAGGCGQDSERPQYRETPVGRVTAIDKDTGIVSMTYVSDKHGKDVALSGRLAPGAEIVIDGVTARLEDVRVGDRVKVAGRVEKKDGEQQLVALKVEIMRRGGDASTRPATSPNP